ncbi:uncharacterized protein LOC143473896 [Brachyhypopomus gauderio]|uniref:uncharacterized protein LOC143473896 n=1 Tax=Brachyhypopomus gauderio TaxID=698409 RepID=UPI004041C719
MSSELTIDIQLTELGFSSCDFEVLEQKETPDTYSSPPSSEPPTPATPWSPAHARSHVAEETSASLDQNERAVFHSPSPEDQTDNTSSTTDGCSEVDSGNGSAHAGGKKRKRTDDDDDDEKDERPNTEDGKRKNHEEYPGIRSTKKNLITDLDVHDEEEDYDTDYDLTDDEGNLVSTSDPDGSEQHRCHVCDLTFSTPFQLQEHMCLHTGVRPYCCAECGKQFCHLVNYRAHLRSHAQVASIHCLICTETFATKEDLQKHLDTNHFEDEFYQCDFCKRIFSNMSECRKHVQEHKQQAEDHQHPGRRTSEKGVFVCTDCGQAFSKKVSLLRHSFYHLGLLPYTCVRCKRHFRLPSLYCRHECKPEHIQCVACLVVFESQDDFEKHKRDTGCWGHQAASPAKATDIRCMECGQVFDTSEELKKHAGTHQRVMKCSECGMGFRSSLMLMSHMGGHAAQRPCLCKECGLGFSHQQAYDSHLKTCGTVNPPEGAMKKLKPKVSKKKEKTVAPKRKGIQIEQTLKDVPQQVPPVPLVNNQSKPSEGLWTLTLNKKPLPGVPLVMFLPVPSTPTSKSPQNPPNLVSSPEVSKKHLSSPHASDISVTSTSNPVSADLDKSVLLQSFGTPGAKFLIPLTSTEDNQMRWTVLHDQSTSGSLMKINPKAKEGTVVAFESKQTSNFPQLTAENEHNKNVLSNKEILNTVPNDTSVDEVRTDPQGATTGAPLCLAKLRTETSGECRKQTESGLGTSGLGTSGLGTSGLENGHSILNITETRSGTALKVENTVLGDKLMGSNCADAGSSENASEMKPEPNETWEEHDNNGSFVH